MSVETVPAETGGIDPLVFQRRWIILGVLCLSLVLVVAAVSSVNVAVTSIRLQLKPSDAQLLWIVDLYAVVFAGLLLPAGAIGDRFGRKGALQAGLLVFASGSVLASQAGSPMQLLICRGIMGIGAAFIMPSTLSLLTSVFPAQERAKAIAVWTGFAGAGGVFGMLFGGFVLTKFWWGSVFFVSVPIAVVAMVLVTVLCPSSKEVEASHLDPIGALMSVAGFGSLLYAIIEGPEKGWGSIHSIGAFLVAAVALTGFVIWEQRASHPMLPMQYFRIPRFGIGALGVTFVFLSMFSMFFMIAQYLQAVRGYTPLRSGVATLPFALTMVSMSPRGPVLAAKYGPKRVVLFGFTIVPIALFLMSLISVNSPYWYVGICVALLALGPALAVPMLSSGIVLSLPLDKAGVGSAVNDTTREVGGAIGIAVIGSVLNSTYKSGLNPALSRITAQLPAANRTQFEPVVQAARRGVNVLASVVKQAPSIPSLKPHLSQLESLLGIARHEFVNGMQNGFRVTAVVMVLIGTVVARWFPSEPLRVGNDHDGQ